MTCGTAPTWWVSVGGVATSDNTGGCRWWQRVTTGRAETHVDQQRGLAARQADELNSLLGVNAYERANPLREGTEMFGLQKVSELLGHL